MRQPLTNPPPFPAIDGVSFRIVVGASWYCVGDDGSVWTCMSRGKSALPRDYWTRMIPFPHEYGHLYVKLRFDGIPARSETVHALVMRAFAGPTPEGLEIRHLDGVAGNNRIGNLCFGTHAENGQDMVKHGSVKGEKTGTAKLTSEQVADIKQRLKVGERQIDIAARYGVKQPAISKIAVGLSWGHIQ